MSETPLPPDEVIREFNDRATLWLLEDPVNLADLLRIIEPQVADCLDFKRAQRVNRSFIQPDLRKQESDLIYRVPVKGGGAPSAEVWVYVLLEHQSKPDREMALRLLLYMTQIWALQQREWQDRRISTAERTLAPVVPVVLYTGGERWGTPLKLSHLFVGPPELRPFIPDWETLFLDVQKTTPETLTRIGTAVGWALRVLQEEKAPLSRLQEVLDEALRGLEELPEEQVGQWIRVARYLLLLIFHRRDPSEYTELRETFWDGVHQSKFRVEEEVARMAMTMAEFVEARGEARGKTQGLQVGLVATLEGKFGTLSPSVVAAIEAADAEQLLSWSRRVGTADSLQAMDIADSTGEG